jgi:ribosomal protein S27E
MHSLLGAELDHGLVRFRIATLGSLFFTITSPTCIDTQIIFISVRSVVMSCPCCVAVDVTKTSCNIAVSLFYPLESNHADTHPCLSHGENKSGQSASTNGSAKIAE